MLLLFFFFYRNVLIAMQKEFLCPSVGTQKLCGTFGSILFFIRKGRARRVRNKPCANGNNTFFLMSFAIRFYAFFFILSSAVEIPNFKHFEYIEFYRKHT